MEMKMMWHVVFIILTMFLSQELSFAQVTGCDEGYSKRLVENSNGVVEPICCKDVVCGPETQVKECTIDKRFDICEDCPNGTTQPRNTSSSEPVKCYVKQPFCIEEGERGPTGECECKAGFCGKYPDCLRSLCPGQNTPAPISETTTSTIATTSTSRSTTISMITPLPVENSTSPGFRTGTTPIPMTTTHDQTTLPPSGENSNNWIVAVIVPIVIGVAAAAVTFWWFRCRRHNGRANHDTENGTAYTPVPTVLRGESREQGRANHDTENGTAYTPVATVLRGESREQDTISEANGRNLHTTVPRTQGEFDRNGGSVHYHVHGNGNYVQIANGPGGQNQVNFNEDHHHIINMDAAEMPPADQDAGQATTPPAEPQHDQGTEARDPIEEHRAGIQEEGEEPGIRQETHPDNLGRENFLSL